MSRKPCFFAVLIRPYVRGEDEDDARNGQPAAECLTQGGQCVKNDQAVKSDKHGLCVAYDGNLGGVGAGQSVQQ